ncbi:hypothetical protein Lfu02_40800 [Longispora fulva]|nr:hypothetical protein Lfu02_40800 [Longispora fulva]
MPLLFVFLVGIGVAVIRRRLLAAPGDPVVSQDAPARLLGWAVGLLAPDRQEWGQAMVGELDRLDDRGRRWRFALGCVGAAVVMPPWGRAAAALSALMAVAASAGGLAVYTHVHYRLSTDGWTWAGAAFLVVLLVGYVLGGSALLRRPGVAAPGLIGGLLVTAVWLTVGGFTFDQWLNTHGQGRSMLIIAVPVVVGVFATLWGGSAAIGRRAARLASVTAALATYLYGILAVAVLGATGHDPSDGWTTAQIVSDNLGNQAVFYLMALPLMTATVGWAAAAGTARLRYGRLATTSPVALPTAAGTDPAAARASATARPHLHDDAPSTPSSTAGRQRRTWYLLLLGAALAATAFLVFLTFLAPHQR